jgi:dTDP-4-amino-4,6-dideoxygalactose transaminase
MIPFNKPYMTGNELVYIAEAHANGILAGVMGSLLSNVIIG